MKKTVAFFNWHQNGDLYHSRGILTWINKHLENTDIHVNLMHTLPNLQTLVEDLPQQYQSGTNRGDMSPYYYISETDKKVLIINTWIASYPYFCRTFDCINATTTRDHTMYIINLINLTYGTSIPYPEVVDIIPTVPTYLPNLSAANRLLELTKGYKKKILVCNGPVISEQTPQFSIAEKIRSLVESHKDCAFIYTENDPTITSDNEFVIDKLVPRSNLNEIVYISTFCDVLVSRMSGPGCAICVHENFFNPNLSFICLTNNQNFAHWYKNGTCKYEWTNNYSNTVISGLIEKHLLQGN